jgi:hypothetical protein
MRGDQTDAAKGKPHVGWCRQGGRWRRVVEAASWGDAWDKLLAAVPGEGPLDLLVLPAGVEPGGRYRG